MSRHNQSTTMSATPPRSQRRQQPLKQHIFTPLIGVILFLSMMVAPVLSAPIDNYHPQPRIPIAMPIRLDDAVEAVPRHAEEDQGAESRYGFRGHYAARNTISGRRSAHGDLR
ncbi:hypothetical protein V8F33_007734 [Rhypophila sp. PSN 637]